MHRKTCIHFFAKKLLIFVRTFDIIIKQSKIASVAQQVEQLIRNQQVAGSNPATSSKRCEVCLSRLTSFFTMTKFEPSRPADYYGAPTKLNILWGNKRSPVRIRPLAPLKNRVYLCACLFGTLDMICAIFSFSAR